MRKPVLLMIAAVMAVSSCSTVRESRFNPLNWFGHSRSEPVAAEGETNPLIPKRRAVSFFQSREEAYRGHPVAEISELRVERRPGGAIILAQGIASRIGPFDVRLTREDDQSTGDTLTYTLRVLQQAGPRDASPRARQVTAARWITNRDLAGIRTIRVLGKTNARSVRR